MMNFAIGFIAAFAPLFAVGLTKARKVSDRVWCILWAALSTIFIIAILFGLVVNEMWFYRGILGMAFAYIISITVHLYGHIFEK
jgi:hypothetical protein